MSGSGGARHAGLAVTGVLLALSGLSVWVLVGASSSLDGWTLNGLTGLDAPGLRHEVVRVVAFGGQFWLVGNVLLVAAAGTAWHRSRWPVLLVPAVALGALDVVALAVKTGVGRTAPHSGTDAVRAGGASYLSGHAANAVLCLSLLAVLAQGSSSGPRSSRRLTAAGAADVVVVVVAGAVGMATVVLGYHWLTDVVAGWLLGLAVALPARSALRRALQPSNAGSAGP